jgi:ligand-binding SRPBCC domain-containing protein
MADLRIHSSVLLRYPREQVFDFFSRAENLNLTTPWWLHFTVLTPLPIEMEQGTLISYRIRLRGIPVRWVSEIAEWEPPCRFTDRQIRGPYRRWVHSHVFEETAEGTVVNDSVRYRVLGGALVNRLFVARELRRIFQYRRAKLDFTHFRRHERGNLRVDDTERPGVPEHQCRLRTVKNLPRPATGGAAPERGRPSLFLNFA